ncbi:M20/M25/M40 family metallo-hydrolase [Actinokineospora bangkokensis]|uniref:Acetylornithine deacetylase n=1 Tax=Actinokineospora bangkokensis TaxID=1193682 RepID=A0A1Q9LLC7_9PSEU|nr:M20/M25/M40 family metallo-hydrolase [Actinokineospora bangkokensis]OLR92831.1 acetylornithine deacetylase [Actinokineospora bangkokensis]
MSDGAGAGEDHDDPVSRLRELVRVPTVSHPDHRDEAAFDRFLDLLARLFPLLHSALELTRVGGHGLLFRWAGTGGGDPVVLMAHTDVVPVAGRWTHPPFDAHTEDGWVWGRGTLDDKGPLGAICEAVEALLADGFTPARDVWLSFGCDEEVFGSGAEAAVAELSARGVRPWFVLDEGGAVAAEALPGLSRPLAVIGVTEKGTTSLRLTATGKGGHASTPARNGPTARIARAISRLERTPLPPRLPEVTLRLFGDLAPLVAPPLRPVLAAASRLPRLVTRALIAAGPETTALARTTIAVTTLSGSPAINVVAATATAGLNIRVMPGDTVAEVVAHVRRVVGPGIEVEVLQANEASPVSPHRGDPAFDLLGRAITAVFPDATPMPYVMMAATDSRHFTTLCDRVYRFAPLRMSKAQRESIHAADERVETSAYLDGIRWFRLLLTTLPA